MGIEFVLKKVVRMDLLGLGNVGDDDSDDKEVCEVCFKKCV